VAIFIENLAYIAERYLRNGRKVYIEGQLQTRKWQELCGQDRYTTEIVLQNYNGTLTLLDKAGETGGGSRDGWGASDPMGGDDRGGFGGDAPARASAASRQPDPFDNDLDDDVPF
jgi:single-strand DNA-binding protein